MPLAPVVSIRGKKQKAGGFESGRGRGVGGGDGEFSLETSREAERGRAGVGMQTPGQESGRTSELNGGAVQALHFPEVLYLREEAGEAGEKTLE